MLLAYLALVVASGAVAAVRPTCTPALVVWYGLSVGGEFVELWWLAAGLTTHVVLGPTGVVMLEGE